MSKTKLLVGDIVTIIAGSNKGKIGPIISISKDKTKVSVKGINVLKHVKPSNANENGGILEKPANISISNVSLQDPKAKDKTTKVGYKIVEGKKVRIARKSKTEIKKTK